MKASDEPRRGRHSRRAFLGRALGAASVALVAPRLAHAQRGPARVRVALLGCGKRGSTLARAAAALPGVDVVAAADPYAGCRVRAGELLGEGLALAADAFALVERNDVDAVVIATPDHLHVPLLRSAVAAGKDAYCESPLSHDLEEGEALVRQLAGNARIVMCSAGRFGSPLVEQARSLVAEGRLGQVGFASASWHTASALDAWLTPYPPDASPETIDFEAFLGPAPPRDFDPARFFRWQRYWDYGTGLAGARFAPMLSALHAILGCGVPTRVQAMGGVHRWRDGREVPDTLVAALDYAGGLSVSLSTSQAGIGPERLQLVGTRASLVLEADELRMQPDPELEPYEEAARSWPEGYRNWFYMMHGLTRDGRPRSGPAARRSEERFGVQGGTGGEAGLADFVACVRSRNPPREDLRHAAEVAAVVHRVNRAYRESQEAPTSRGRLREERLA